MAKVFPYHSVERAEAVSTLVQDWWNRPLVWGTWDCVQMCRDMAVRLRANDCLKDWAKYNSKHSARKSLQAAGFKTLTEAVTSKCEKIDVNGLEFDAGGKCLHYHADIGLGDIVEIKGNTKQLPALGIFVGQDAVLLFCQDLGDVSAIKVQRIDMQYFTGNAWRII